MRDTSASRTLPVHWPPWARLAGLTCLALVPIAVTKAEPRLVVMVGLTGTVLLILGMSRPHDDRYMKTFPFSLSRMDGEFADDEHSRDWRLARAGLIALIYLAVAAVGNGPPQIIAALSPAAILGIWSNQVPVGTPSWVVVIAMVAGLTGALTFAATSEGGQTGGQTVLAALMYGVSAYILIGLISSMTRSRRA